MNHAPEVPTNVVLHVTEEHLEELVGGADVGVEVHEVDTASDERGLRGVEVRLERRGAIPEVDYGGGGPVAAAAVAEEGGPSVRGDDGDGDGVGEQEHEQLGRRGAAAVVMGIDFLPTDLLWLL